MYVVILRTRTFRRGTRPGPTVTIIKDEDEDDYDWLERGQPPRLEKEVLLKPESENNSASDAPRIKESPKAREEEVKLVD